jgi:hypothetical protein
MKWVDWEISTVLLSQLLVAIFAATGVLNVLQIRSRGRRQMILVLCRRKRKEHTIPLFAAVAPSK